MKCGRCHEPIDEESLRSIIVPGHRKSVDVCPKCYDEYCIISATSKTMLRRAVRKWFEFKALNLSAAIGSSVHEFDITRHRILSLASGVMFELITEMVETDAIGGIVGVRHKMKELLADIDLGVKDEPCAHGMT